MQEQCPHAMKIGSNTARIEQLERRAAEMSDTHRSRIAELEKKIVDLTEQAQEEAMRVIEDKAQKSGFVRGMHMTATLIGYGAIIIALVLAGKVTGGIDMFIKFLGSLDLK